MAHLPEPIDDLDEPLLATSDPVVRAPKVLVAMPEPPSYAIKTVVSVALTALTIGASLGAVGLGIFYATHLRPRASVARRSRATTSNATSASPATISLSSPDAGSGSRGSSEYAPPQIAVGPYADYTIRTQRLGRRHTFPQTLRMMGLDANTASNVVRALRPLLNMRTLQPSDLVVAMREPAHQAMRRIEYRRSDTLVWAVTIGPDGTCTGERIDVVKTASPFAAGFVVSGSLEDTLRAARLQPDIVNRLQDVFGALDLGTQLHRGDAVRILGEEERLNGIFYRYSRIDAIDYRGAMGQRRAYFHRLGARGGDFFNAHGEAPERGPLRSPLPEPRITSPFNLHRMHPVLHRVMPHLGTDFGAPIGTPVYAAADGIVVNVNSGGPTGNLVRLSHPQLGIETGYAHLSRFAPGIHAGQHVHVHDLVGYVGSTGRSTGPHLHMSCKRGGQFFDCQTIYRGRRVVPAASRAEFDTNVARWNEALDAIRLDGVPTGAPPVQPTPASDTAPVTEEDGPPGEE
jgi:murein DD-endopeptidase MepM/ murein hydrolase activator NlpD